MTDRGRAGAPVLLQVDSSADRRAGSVTRELGAAYARGWLARHPDGVRRYRDLAAAPVPPLGQGYVSLGTRVERHGVVPPEKVAALAEGADEEREWAVSLPLITEVREATTLLVGAPMYNFSVPAALKAWIDRITFPGAYVDPDGGGSLLAGVRVVVVAACGGGYGAGAPRAGWDFQVPYLRAYFVNLGVAEGEVRVVRAEFTRAGDVAGLGRFREAAVRGLARARGEVAALAAEG
ncbi:NAD(P)H-dependent oxidoreductase [Streptomyces sp. CC224B]|uniref:NAD(P)H-dependent oxidoreductase n=1 Tax=Streptomyces sp. CC224B TaxID=3044571 RepID=UPI0024A87B87|nr:NAD(P)H-dependent oxidoreductase [Streptomyces sp. CC224B]